VNSSSSPSIKKKKKKLPPWNIILHNDDVNKADFVCNKVQEYAHLPEEIAIKKVLEAHDTGKSLLLTTHKEQAELIVQQFESSRITVTMQRG